MTRFTASAQRVRRGRAAGVWLGALAALFLSGCGGNAGPEPPTTFDNGGERARRSGMQAFSAGRYTQAANSFRRALAFAYQRDDSDAVVDARYNLAASLTGLEDYDEALRMLDAAEAELRRDGEPITTDIALLRATVDYRSGRAEQAGILARQVRDSPDVDPALAARAWFLTGLIAADSKDRPGLALALAALGATDSDPRLRADRAELSGRLAALQANPLEAIDKLGEAARERSDVGDYRATARALATAGEIARQAGLTRDASEHFLRAGRSAAAQGAVVPAREWLEQARTLALQSEDPQSADEAATALAALEEQSTRTEQ